MATQQVYHRDGTGLTLYAFPVGIDLTTWTTNRQALTETPAGSGFYAATLDSANAETWVIFEGAAEPASYTDARQSIIDLSDAPGVLRDMILAGDQTPIATDSGAVSNVGSTENLANYDWATSEELSNVDSRVETLANDQASGFSSQASELSTIKGKTNQLTFTEANKVDATAEATVDQDALAAAIREKLAALIVWLSSPHDQETGELKLAASTEYKTGGPLGPLSFKLTNASVAASDAVRFVAQLTTDDGTEQIDLAGTVTLDGSDYFATFEIDAADLDVSPSVAWRYSVLHGTGPAAIIADQPLAVLPSRLPAA